MSSTTLGPVAETTKVIPLPQPSAVFGFTAPMEGGKSTISQAVSEQLNLPRVSVGDFPRRLANSPEPPVTRETLPDLDGRPVHENAVEFCRAVLTEQHIPSGVPLLIDGVCHQEILDALANLLGTTPEYLIFINNDPETQSARFREDHSSRENTLEELQRHSTEAQVRSVLLDRASLILDGKRPVDELVSQVIRFIQDPPATFGQVSAAVPAETFPKPGTPEWGLMNQRRAELIRKDISCQLNTAEQIELERLQRLSLAAVDEAFPYPEHDKDRERELDERLRRQEAAGG